MPDPPPRPSPEATYDLAWRYGRDLARLNMVDPEKVFFMWEVSDATARRGAGRPGKLGARLIRLDEAGEHVVATAEGVFAVMTWYWDSEAGSRYRAEIGWVEKVGAFEPWLASNVLATPRLAPNLTAQVLWRTKATKGTPKPAPRGPGGAFFSDDLPSARPRDAASAAQQRKREALRELVRAPWSATNAPWSRTAIPTSRTGGRS
jgi:hypothetical protein